MLIRKARVKWNHDADLNSKYFHYMVKGMARGNYTRVVNTEKRLVESVDEVKEVIRSFFKNKLTQPNPTRPYMEGIYFKFLT